MRRWFHRSIRNKLAAAVLVAVLPSILMVSVMSAWRDIERRHSSLQDEFAGIAAALAAAVSEPLASGNTRQVANALKGIGAIPNIRHVGVVDKDERPVFQFGAGILVQGAPPRGSLFNLQTTPISVPVMHAGGAIGVLTLVADMSELAEALKRSVLGALFSGVLSAIVGLFLARRAQRSIADPIARLTAAMAEVRDTRDFTATVAKTSEDETGALVETFNDMSREFRLRDAELAAHRAGLECQVAERTRDLATAVQDAEAANAAKSEFLATMSHEIRTPMNGMLVMAELLASGDLSPRARRQCDVILRSGQTLLAIINDILDLSKIEAGKLTLETVTVDPAAVVDDVVKLFSERAESKGLQLAVHVASDVPAVIAGDPVRLGQVVSNLVSNALKFTESGGVLVRVTRACDVQDRLVIGVTDTGIGIPQDKIAGIFDPFTQAEQSTTRRFGGTGIGLTISRRLVEAMGGTLAVVSEFGEGSTFSFALPLTAPADLPEVADAPRIARGCALLVLQEGAARTAFGLLAADLGLEPVACSVGEAVDPRGDIVLAVSDAATMRDHSASLAALGVPILVIAPAGVPYRPRHGVACVILERPYGSREAREAMCRALGDATREVAEHNESVRHSPARGAFEGLRVLAADDSAVNREVLVEALRRLDVEVVCVDDGVAAVEAVETGGFDLVFMDGSMPVMDGFAATREIRARELRLGRPHLPIIGLSAHVIGARSDLWRDAGMTDFIAKPFTLAAIRKCLERWAGAPPATLPASPQAAQDLRPNAGVLAEAVAILDCTVLDSIREMQAPDDDLVGRVIGLFVETAPRQLAKLHQCVARPGETAAIASAAHALKSMCRNIGALRMGELCEVIEDDARASRPANSRHMEELTEALPATIDALQDVTARSEAA